MRWLGCALLLVLGVGSAAATTAPSLYWLAAQADVIAVGRCESAASSWDDEHRYIVTTIHFRQTETLKGAASEVLTVRVLGGQVGDAGMLASDSVAMAAGEEAVLFLQPSRFGPYFVVTGGAQGKLSISADPVSGAPLVHAPSGVLPVAELRRRIEQGSE